MADFETPAIVYGLRGLTQLNITLHGPKLDLHSGVYGGGIGNPINILARLLAQLQDEQGHVLIPGFYDRVRPLSATERDLINAFPFDEQEWLRRVDAPQAWGEPVFTILERVGARPTLDINGIVGGYTGPGGKTIIPARAHAKLSMRLAPDQDPHEIAQLAEAYIRQLTPPQVRLEIQPLGAAAASLADYTIPAMRAAKEACKAVFGRTPVFKREGGTLPVVATMQQALGLQPVMLGFGLPHDRIHAPNERFYLPNFYKGMETVIHFLAYYRQV
jgi:acetylornithine deacetylase/succinyl-diaminopimelate desuccinylase-like protein